MGNTVVFLIRHGEIDNPRNIIYGSNIEMQLANTGKDQMQRLAAKILKSGNVPSKIFSSPLQRTMESSNILASIWGISDIQVEEDLKDSYVPALAGQPTSVLAKLRSKGEDAYSDELRKQGNESRQDIATRMFRAYQKAISNISDSIALVSHGDPILFLLYKLENPDSSEIPMADIIKNTIDYLSKGHAWKLLLDEKANLLSKEIITPL